MSTGSIKTVAWYVYVDQHNAGYAISDLDDPLFVDDVTNHGATAEPLILRSDAEALVKELREELFELNEAWRRHMSAEDGVSVDAVVAIAAADEFTGSP